VLTRSKPRVALVHDYWVTLRGGEYVFRGLARLFPNADCYVLVHRRDVPTEIDSARWNTSPLQLIPWGARHYRALLPLYPMAARRLDLRGYDLVISSSSGFCHHARTNGTHLCYCHTPLRYAWSDYADTLAHQRSALRRTALAFILDRVRRADYAAAQRVTHYVANSSTVQARIAEYYDRPSTIVHPFIDLPRFHPIKQPDDYLLVVSQLLPYKRVDLAIEACRRLRRRLIIVGDGPERARLQRIAGPLTTFAGRVSEPELVALYARCAALLQCGVEDFGLAALEAQACGRPVIAYGAGGALETVIPGQTGLYFSEQSMDALFDVMRSFDPADFDGAAVRAHAEHFDETQFRRRLLRVIDDVGSARETQHRAPATTVLSPVMVKPM